MCRGFKNPVFNKTVLSLVWQIYELTNASTVCWKHRCWIKKKKKKKVFMNVLSAYNSTHTAQISYCYLFMILHLFSYLHILQWKVLLWFYCYIHFNMWLCKTSKQSTPSRCNCNCNYWYIIKESLLYILRIYHL